MIIGQPWRIGHGKRFIMPRKRHVRVLIATRQASATPWVAHDPPEGAR